MKVAVALSQDDVVEVVKRANAGAIESEERWSTDIARPAILLATSTMPQLSAGFGVPLAYLAVLSFIHSLANFVGLIHLIVTASQNYTTSVLRFFSSVSGMLAPIFLAFDVAFVSSMCDELQERINHLRLDWPDVATAQRVHTLTYPLQFTLSKLNQSQGLGFAVGHLVVDKKTLNMLMISGKDRP